MVRKLYAIPGKPGFVVKSFMYKQASREFAGYRFRYYPDSPEERFSEILTVFLPSGDSSSEINYSCDAEGRHYFLNNLPGHKNIWRMDPGNTAVIKDGVLPAWETISSSGRTTSNIPWQE